MKTYRITYLIGSMDISTCPPAFLKLIFPNFNGEPVTLCEQYCDVTFPSEQTPVQISPLVKVELLTENQN